MGMDMVNVGGYYVTASEAQALLEDAEADMLAEKEYFETYTAFDGRTGRDYVKDKTLQHPFPTAFKHFHKTIGLDPEEAHLLACGENRFDLQGEDFNNEKRALASRFYDWLLENDYWDNSGEWEAIGDSPPPEEVLESPIFSFLEEYWCEAKSHPLYELLKPSPPTVVFKMRRLHYDQIVRQARINGEDPKGYLEAYAREVYDWESAPEEVQNYSGFVNWDIQIID